MTSRERIMAVLTGKKPDRIPWAPLIDRYYTQSLPLQGLNMNEIETIKYIGGDIILRHVEIQDANIKNVEFKTMRKGDNEIRIYETPVGNIESRYKYSGGTCFKEEPFIKTKQDIKIMQYIVENTEYKNSYDNFIMQNKLIGEYGIATPSSPLTPIQTLLQHEMGIEKFTYILYDNTNEMEELMEAMHQRNLKSYKLFAEAPNTVKVFISYEDTSTTVMGPSWYKQYCKNYLDQYADILHGGNKIFIAHMCGKLKGLVKEIGSSKMDGIDSVCPPTTGDLWAHEALTGLPDKIIIGGIEPPALKRMNVEETKQYVKDIIEKCPSNERFILSTGDATSYGTPIENLLAVTEIVNEAGKFEN